VGGADAVEMSDTQLALIHAATSKDNIANSEPQFRGLDITRRTPPPNSQRTGIEVLKPNVVINVRLRGIIDAVIYHRRHFVETKLTPAVV
jgi:hypothetical protein